MMLHVIDDDKSSNIVNANLAGYPDATVCEAEVDGLKRVVL